MAKKILVVDDEPMLCEILKDFLELDAYEVSEAHSGKEAFEMIAVDSFDCVISDVRMPDGDGAELAQKILNMHGKKPIVFLTTGFSDISDEYAKSLHVVEVLHKPFVYEELLSSVRKMVV